MQVVWVVLSAGLVAGLSYLVGSIPWGFLIGKFNGLDIRYHGSGNIGATNVRRVLGRDWGGLCFAADLLKGLLPVICFGLLLSARTSLSPEYGKLLAAAGAVAGHVWPFWLGFKGGKGVATSIGALLAVSWVAVVIALITWLVVFYSVRYVSLASLAAAVMLPVGFALLRVVRGETPWGPTLVLLLVLAALIIVRHRSNLKRLLQGTEHRFERKKRRV